MIYRAHSDAKIEVGGWPQFFRCVFDFDATSELDAKVKAERSMKESDVEFENLYVEFVGRKYEVLSNDEFSVAGVHYQAGSVSEVRIYPGTMQISIDCVRHGRRDSDSIGVWCRPADFKNAVDGVFASMRYKEI